MKRTPKHIAIIPDGNRRWAKNKKYKVWSGHQEGSEKLEKILNEAIEMKIKYITFWGASFDNLTKRSKIETGFLFKIFEKMFRKISTDKRIHKNKIHIDIFGQWEKVLPKKTKKAIENAKLVTKNYKNYFLTFFIAYNGTDEMKLCIEKIVNSSKDDNVKITDKLIKDNLFTKDMPPVDLVIRTGCDGDPHFSAGFMMWDTAYSQFHFTKTLFPDFTTKEFKEIIENFKVTNRRLGK